MLKNTFSHIKGISEKTEQLLWNNNLHTWDDFLNANSHPVSAAKVKIISEELNLSQKALEDKNHLFFSQKLPSKNHWRLFEDFQTSAAYLDIETTGLDIRYSKISTIALYDGKNIKHYINGINLFDFVADANHYKMFISYNGKTFDVPFIERIFNRKFNQSHIDLRYVLKNLGFQGGLKTCEKQLGISRNELAGIDGYFAVILWNEYKQRKNQKALETLLAYNIEDVVNLEFIMHHAYNLKTKDLPFHKPLSIPPRPEIPFKADMELVKKLQQNF